MALHKFETVEKPAADAPASAWEAYLAGLKEPAADAPPADWEEYLRLEDEAAEAAPEATYANRTPVAHPDLLGVGSKASAKR